MSRDADLFGETAVRERLATFLSRHHRALTRIESLRRYSVGFSWITYGFAASWADEQGSQQRQLVLRIGPPAGLFAPYRAAPECIVLQSIHGHGVPVPRIHAFSDTAEDFGAPFFIGEHLPGIAPLPWVASGKDAFEPGLRASLAEQFVSSLAALHRFEWSASPVAALAQGVTSEDAAARLVTHWAQLLRRWQLRDYPVVEQALVWLHRHCPIAPSSCRAGPGCAGRR